MRKELWRSRYIQEKYAGEAGELDEELQEEYAIWRLVSEKIATLQEIDNHWSVKDILKANAILDMKIDLEKYSNEKQKQEQNNRR